MAYTSSNVIGEVTEVTGEAKIIRADGTEEVVTLGTEVFEGDIVETEGASAVNIGFIDESSFAVSSDARIAIDEFVFDPNSEAGAQDFSVLRGVFMYTSGLIGRENPDSVEIDTPVGSIGIRGTIIGGNINPDGESQVTVIEGAIVVRTDVGERLLTTQYDTVSLTSINQAPSEVRTLNVQDVANDYGAVKDVSAGLFSSFNDQMQEEGPSNNLDETSVEETLEEAVEEEAAAEESVAEEIVEGEAEGGEKKIQLKSMKQMAEEAKDIEDISKDEMRERVRDIREQNDLNNEVNVKLLSKLGDESFVFKVGSIVDENSPIGTVVGTVGATRPMPFDVRYELTNDAGGLLDIDATTGVVTLAQVAPDFEGPDQNFDVGVRVTRLDTGQSIDTSLHVFLRDVNEAPTDIVLGASNIDENSTGGTVVGVLSSTDEDSGDSPTYSITGGTGSSVFEIVGNEVRVKSGAVLNHETTPSYTLTIEVEDSAGNTYPETFTISIDDVNEAPTDIVLGASNIDEDATSGTVVGVLSSTDEDSGDAATYSITGGTGSSVFEISANQLVLKSGAVLNHETIPSYTLTIEVEDGAGNTYDETFTINIDDVNEVAEITAHTTNILAENDSGLSEDFVVSGLTFVDADNSGSGFETTFSTSDSRFAVQMNAGQLQLVALAGASFDFDTEGSTINVNITQTDGANAYTDYTVPVVLTNLIDETPTDISIDSNEVNESAGNGTIVGFLSATDADAGDKFTYEIINGNDDGIFSIDGNQLRIDDNTNLDYEGVNAHSLGIRVTDDAGNTYDKTISIAINDIDEPATISVNLEDYTGSAAKLVLNQFGAEIGQIDIDDPEMAVFSESDFTINGTFGEDGFNLSDYFEVKNIDGEFILKLQDSYKMIFTGSVYQIEDTSGDTAEFGISSSAGISVSLSGGNTIPLQFDIVTPSGNAAGTGSNDVFKIYGDDFAAIDGGDGYDTLVLDGRYQGGRTDMFDLRDVNTDAASGQLKGIEEIKLNDLNNDSHNILKMDISGIIDLLDSSATGKLKFTNSSDPNAVRFYDDSNNQETLVQNGFTASGTVDEGGETFYVFTHANGEVLIQDDIVGAAGGGQV
jgi:hypothetical protein